MPALDDTLPVRPARDDELDALLALEQASFSGDRLSRRQYRHHLRSASARVLAVHQDGRLIGSAVVLLRRGARVARLYSIAVDSAARGRGVGRQLLAAVEAQARARGCSLLRLEVRADNRAAQALYEQVGFRRRGERPDYYEDGATAWLYEKLLDVSPD